MCRLTLLCACGIALVGCAGSRTRAAGSHMSAGASARDTISRARVTLVPPDSTPTALFDSLGTVAGSPLSAGPYRRDIVIVEFKLGTPLAVRQAAIDSVSGKVVGGVLDDDKQDGAYYVRIQGGTTAALLTAVQILQRQPQVAIAIWLNIGPGNFHQDRRTVDSDRWKNAPDATRDLRSRGRVPAQAPDSISSALWDSLTAPANLMTNAPHLKGTWARNVMFITFERTATQADRQAAIALISGEVVGGDIWPMGERAYIVRIPYALPGDSVSGPVLRAFLALKDHPSVVAAYPLGMDNHNVIYNRRPTDGPSIWTAPSSARPSSSEPPADALSIGAWLGLAHHSPGRPFGSSTGNDLAIAAIRLTRTLHQSATWSVEYSADILPVAVVSIPRETDPLVVRPCDPNGSACEFRAPFAGQRAVYGFGAAPLGLQLRLAPRRTVQPFLTASGGAIWFREPVPAVDAGRFNFTAEVGAGVLVRPNRALGVMVGYKLQHISNGGTSRFNPGIDNNVFYVGLVRPVSR
jgi:hypothetical protein